jgi:hypothetical protein
MNYDLLRGLSEDNDKSNHDQGYGWRIVAKTKKRKNVGVPF